MNRMLTLSASGLLAVLFTGCITCGGEKEPCADTLIPTTSLDKEYGCTNTIRLPLNLQQPYTIIRNQADFDRVVTEGCRPQIDFAKYDLIIGRAGSGSGTSTAAYTYRRDCTNGQLRLQVKFTPGPTNDAPILTYHALVPKLAPQETVLVDVE